MKSQRKSIAEEKTSHESKLEKCLMKSLSNDEMSFRTFIFINRVSGQKHEMARSIFQSMKLTYTRRHPRPSIKMMPLQ